MRRLLTVQACPDTFKLVSITAMRMDDSFWLRFHVLLCSIKVDAGICILLMMKKERQKGKKIQTIAHLYIYTAQNKVATTKGQ